MLKNIKWIFIVVFLAIVIVIPQVINNTYVVHVMILTLIYTLLSMGQNIMSGCAGMLSMGQAGFYGIGAYVAALVNLYTDIPPLISLLICILFTFVTGLLLGIPCSKLGGDYLTLITIGFNTIVQLIFTNWNSFTNGPRGLRGIDLPSIFGYECFEYTSIFYLYLVIVIIAYVLMDLLLKSRFGRAFYAIRDDETAAASVGINVPWFRILAVGFGSMLAGIAGWMLAHFITFVGPTTFSTDESLIHMEMAILGGLGSMPGSVLGAIILTIIPQLLQSIYEYRLAISGVLMIVMMIWRPQGLIGSKEAGKSLIKNLDKQLSLLLGKHNRTPKIE